jgi:hypothetical protein
MEDLDGLLWVIVEFVDGVLHRLEQGVEHYAPG